MASAESPRLTVVVVDLRGSKILGLLPQLECGVLSAGRLQATPSSALECQPQRDARIIAGAEFDALIPGGGSQFKAALHPASDGTAEPTYSVSKIALGAIRQGVKIVAPCAARAVEREGSKVAGVHTENGYIKARHVALADVVWSSLFAGNVTVQVPQLTIVSSMQRSSHIGDALPGARYGPDFTWPMQAMVKPRSAFARASLRLQGQLSLPARFLPTLNYSGEIV